MAISTTSYSPNGWVTIAGTSYRFKRYSGGGGDYTDCLTFTGETSEFTLAVGSNGAREWDDESVQGEEPYGEKIGSSAPFDEIVDAMTESIYRALYSSKKKV